MKKFFSLMLVALVMLGVTACEQNVTIDTPKSEGLSFYAEIAMTRADLVEQGTNENGNVVWNTIWEVGDELAVNDGNATYYFKNSSDDVNKFTCEDEDAVKLLGKAVTVDLNNGTEVWTLGKKGIKASASVAKFATDMTVELIAMNSFFRYTYTGEGNVRLSLTYANQDTVPFGYDYTYYPVDSNKDTEGNVWVAFDVPTDGDSATLSYSIYGVNIKEKTDFEVLPGKVYNLGTLMEPEVNEMFGIVGAHNGWNTENADALYLIPNTNTYVRYNVTLAEGGFKFYGETTKTVIVEHPAVTTGEEGDWYLQPNSNWKEANARFAVYFFNDAGNNAWVSMKDDNGDGIYVANNPTDGNTYTKMIFCRMNPSTTDNNWDNKWNQTADLTCPTDGKNCFTVPSGTWDGATSSWSIHTPEVKDAWTEEVEEVTPYWIGKESTDNITNWVTRWSNNGGNDNIVVDTTKTYDIYFSKAIDQDWGFEVYYTVLESGSEAPVLK